MRQGAGRARDESTDSGMDEAISIYRVMAGQTQVDRKRCQQFNETVVILAKGSSRTAEDHGRGNEGGCDRCPRNVGVSSFVAGGKNFNAGSCEIDMGSTDSTGICAMLPGDRRHCDYIGVSSREAWR